MRMEVMVVVVVVVMVKVLVMLKIFSLVKNEWCLHGSAVVMRVWLKYIVSRCDDLVSVSVREEKKDGIG